MRHPSEKILHLSVVLLFFFISACHPPVTSTDSPTPELLQTSSSTPIQIPAATTTPPFQAADPDPSPTTTSTSKTERRVTLMAVGDIMLGRTIGELIEEEGFEAPFLYTAETLNQADLTIGNLECPISTQGTPEGKKYTFCAPLAAGQSLAYAGFDLVSLANNHTLDYGESALQETMDTLAENGILWAGAGMDADSAYQPVFIEINGLRLAFLAFMDIPLTEDFDYLSWEAGDNQPGVAWAHADKISECVRQAKVEADIVIVLVHNGYEIVQKVSSEQQEVAHLAIDSGASLVIGSHPHVLQRIEEYNGSLIVYSMGNFVFDNFLFPPNYSAILSVELSPQGVESYEMIDVIVQLDGVPQIMPYDLDE